jgi:predicted ATP-grasp superfamily ATP-dependent carboligase
MASKSKYTYASFTYPSPYVDPRGFVQAVIKAGNRYKANIFIPIHEEIFATARHRDLFPQDFIIPISSYENILRAHDKALTMQYAESIGIPIPKTFYVRNINELPSRSEQMEYPALIKLRKSNSAKGVFKVENSESLLSMYSDVIERFNLGNESLPIIQEYIPGTVYAVSMLFDNGELVAKFTRRNIREKTFGGGTCTKCVSVENKLLESYAETILSSMKWHGVAMLEFKYDEERNAGYLLEINPRYHGTISHDIEAGMRIPYWHYLIGLEHDVRVASHYKLGFKSRWIIGDFISLYNHISKTSNKLQWLKDFTTFDEDNYMDFKKDDIKPFLYQSIYYLKKFAQSGSDNPIDKGMLG